MTEYRRFHIPKAICFFTVNLAERKNNHLLADKINELRDAFRYIKQRKPFQTNAIVIIQDHLHCIRTMPPDDGNFSTRWNRLNGRFSRAIDKGERISKSRQKRRERGIWQRRFWAHLIEDQEDYNRHVDYIHRNPVKHGNVKKVIDLPTGHKGLIQVFTVMLNKVFIQRIGEIMNHKILNNSNDAPPDVGSILYAHLIGFPITQNYTHRTSTFGTFALSLVGRRAWMQKVGQRRTTNRSCVCCIQYILNFSSCREAGVTTAWMQEVEQRMGQLPRRIEILTFETQKV